MQRSDQSPHCAAAHDGRSLRGPRPPAQAQDPRRNQNINISSKFMSRIEDDKSAESVEYTEEMQAREAAARKEAERRKKCVAPAFNKGPYQYIFTEEQAKDVGRS